MKIVLAGTMDSISTRVDGSVKVSISTNEMDSLAAGMLFQLRGKYIKCLLSDNNITEMEANVVDAETLTGTRKKSQSARLRAVLYVQWEQSGYSVSFEDYYRTEMEKLIEGIKQNLDRAA